MKKEQDTNFTFGTRLSCLYENMITIFYLARQIFKPFGCLPIDFSPPIQSIDMLYILLVLKLCVAKNVWAGSVGH